MITDIKTKRSEILPGDVLVSCKKDNPLSKIISDITDSPWSHSFLYIGLGKILESGSHGVIIDDLDKYLDTERFHIGVRRLSSDPMIGEALVDACKKDLGIKYGLLQLFYIGVMYFLRVRRDRRWIRLDLPGIICSELIARGMTRISHLCPYPYGDRPPHDIEPKDHGDTLTVVF